MNEFSFNIIDASRQKEGLYWKQHLPAGEIAYGLDWIPRGPVPAHPSSHHHQRHFAVPGAAYAALNRITRGKPENVHAVLMAIQQLLFYKYTAAGSCPVLFTPAHASMQQEEYDEAFLPVYCPCDPTLTFGELLGRMQQCLRNAFVHRHYPLRYLWHKLYGPAQSYARAVLLYDRVHDLQAPVPAGTEISYLFRDNGQQLVLELEYTDACHHWYAENAAFHFIRLLSELDANRDVPLAQIDILLPAERERILYKLNPEVAALPVDKTVVQYLHEYAMATPQQIAFADQQEAVTYAALSQQVYALAATLAASGVQPGTPVAVLLERGVSLATVILAIWQAGGVYIPVDLKFPLKRIQLIADDAVALLITRQQYLDNELQEGAFAAVLTTERLFAGTDTGLTPAGTEQADASPAYIIYTSGSTGVPKGAMITHAGMVNQLQAKAKDLQIHDASIVAQTASHVFDISIWQLFAAIVKGGTVRIFSNETVMDPVALVAALQQDHITHLQVVPSYLVVLLEYVKQHHPALDELQRLVSAGEELRVHQATQWLDLYPHIPILNAYGPTEASIDVLHYEVTAKPSGFVPIGKPLKHTAIYIVDDHMSLCPEGVKGEICIAGIGTGIGYLNNPVKTSQSFVPNIFDESRGAALYKTGDIGCWLQDGNIRFFGRRDHQVKIRGFRIELAEVENSLLKNPLVKETVVVTSPAGEGQSFLCAYVRLQADTDPLAVQQWLATRVPDYMVPAHFQVVEAFEKLPSGKINRHALPAIQAQHSGGPLQPRTGKEQTIASVWERLLGIDQVNLHDNFFRLGGDSIRAIQLASRLRTAGISLSIEDIFAYPTVAAMAGRSTIVTGQLPQETVTGEAPLSPIQQYFFTRYGMQASHYNQAVMLDLQDAVTDDTLQAIAAKLTAHHDALRMQYRMVNDTIVQENAGLSYPVAVHAHDLSGFAEPWKELERIAGNLQAGIDLSNGPLMHLAVFRTATATRLLIIIHHLVTDGVSWRILLEDLDALLQQVKDHQPLALPAKTSSFSAWTKELEVYRTSAAFRSAADYWENDRSRKTAAPVRDLPGGRNLFGDIDNQHFSLDKEETASLLAAANEATGIHTQELLLIALIKAMHDFFGIDTVHIDTEGHGREAIADAVNIHRTMGWFTSIYPVYLEMPQSEDLVALVRHNKSLLRKIPNNGFDYLPWLFAQDKLPQQANAPVLFNYLGRFDTDMDRTSFRGAGGSFGRVTDPLLERTHDLEITGAVAQDQLWIRIAFSDRQYDRERIRAFAGHYRQSIGELVQFCSAAHAATLTPDDLTFKEIGEAGLAVLQQRFAVQDVFTLSPTQEGMLYHALLEPGSLNYFVQIAYGIKGQMDVAVMEQAFHALLDRHDILRAHFVWEHEQRPVQVIGRNDKEGFAFCDLTATDAGGETAESCRRRDLAMNFSMREGLLIRLTAVKTGADEFELIWSFHHILMDGWCTNILAKEFLIIYHALLAHTAPDLPAPAQYVSYIRWLEQRDKAQASSYWKKYLQGFDTATVLPLREKVNLQKEIKVKEHVLQLDTDASAQLQELALTAGVTLYTILQSAWALMLSFYNNNKDVVFGSVVAGRPAEIDGIESMVGLFINTLPVRVQLEAGDRLFELYRSVQQDALRSTAFDFYPLAKIQSESGLDKDLVSHILVYENYPLDIHLGDNHHSKAIKSKVGSLDIRDVNVFEQTNYDLSVIIAPGREMQVKFQYRPDALDDQTIANMATRFQYILRQLINGGDVQVKAIEPLLPAEEKLVRHRFNSTRRQYPLQYNVEELFLKRVRENSERIAVVCGEDSITYGELDRRAGLLAAVLTAGGHAGPGKKIGLLMHRSVQTVVAIMGIIRSGSAYVPVSPYLPQSRIEYMIKDCGCEAIVCNAALASLAAGYGPAIVIEEALAATPVAAGLSPASPDDLIYMIYTSGSTGRPKGVEITHRNVVNLLFGLNEIIYSSFDTPCRLALVSPFDFDASIQHLFGALILGHTLYIVHEEARADGYAFMQFLAEKEIDISDGTPTHLRLLLESGLPFPPALKHLLIAGEELPKNLVEEFSAKQPGTRITNLYGPTETCVDASYFHIDYTRLQEWHRIPIGKPLPNLQVYILDRELRLLPPGVTGEIFIGGEGVSRGYHGQEKLTSEKFIANPYRPGERLYRTGDLGRWLPDGNLAFAGRADNQLKIRGFRIEPGEIEHVLKQLEGIGEVVVVAKGQSSSVKLSAFYTSSQPFTNAELRAFAETSLPYYMVPSFFTRIPQVPLTSTNKTDIQALLALQQTEETGRSFIAPGNQTEELLSGIWKNILGLQTIGIHDNFFEAGGNSIDLVRVYGQMKTKLNFEEPLVRLIEFPTIHTLSGYLLQSSAQQANQNGQQEQIRQANEKKLSQRALRKMALEADSEPGV